MISLYYSCVHRQDKKYAWNVVSGKLLLLIWHME